MTIDPGSRLREILGAERLGVNTFHHQAIDRVAPGLVVTARSVERDAPGLIEPMGARFLMGEGADARGGQAHLGTHPR